MLDSGWYWKKGRKYCTSWHLGTLGLFQHGFNFRIQMPGKVFLRTQFSKLRVCFIQHWFSKHNIGVRLVGRVGLGGGLEHPWSFTESADPAKSGPSTRSPPTSWLHICRPGSRSISSIKIKSIGPFMYCYIMILLLWTKSDFLWDIYIYTYIISTGEKIRVYQLNWNIQIYWQSCDDQGI